MSGIGRPASQARRSSQNQTMTPPSVFSPLLRIDDYVRRHAGSSTQRVALVEGQHRISYAEAGALIDQYQRAMIAQGVRRKDLVAVFGYSTTRTVAAFLAAAGIGASYIGLNPKYSTRELSQILRDCDPVLLMNMVGEDDADKLQKAVPKDSNAAIVVNRKQFRDSFIDLAEFLERGRDVGEVQLQAYREGTKVDDPAVVLYTSGSTGAPKGAMLSHHSLVRGAEILAQLVPEQPRCLSDYPINHISWVLETCLLTLILGGTLFLRERFDPEATLRLIEEERLGVWQGAPSMFFLCLETPDFSSRDLSSLESVIYLGGGLPVGILQSLRDKTGARLATGWGMTETSGGCTLTDSDADFETLATTVGRPDPRIELRLIDETGRAVNPGDPGEIIVRGETLFLGYLNNQEATDEVMDSDGFLHTGDIGVMRDDGNIRLVGRKKEMFKSGGYNVYPTEVESVIGEHEDIATVAVVGVPDDLWGEVGVAFIIPRSKSDFPTKAELSLFCKERLANYKVPKEFVILPHMPLLPTGKVDKKLLREEHLQR